MMINLSPPKRALCYKIPSEADARKAYGFAVWISWKDVCKLFVEARYYNYGYEKSRGCLIR